MSDIEQVVIRHFTSKGKPRYHLGYRTLGGPLNTAEACNIDQAGKREELDDLPEDVDDRHLCRRCWGSE